MDAMETATASSGPGSDSEDNKGHLTALEQQVLSEIGQEKHTLQEIAQKNICHLLKEGQKRFPERGNASLSPA